MDKSQGKKTSVFEREKTEEVLPRQIHEHIIEPFPRTHYVQETDRNTLSEGHEATPAPFQTHREGIVDLTPKGEITHQIQKDRSEFEKDKDTTPFVRDRR